MNDHFALITPVVLTFNEAPNIARTLEPLEVFPKVIVVDSGSTDETLEIARGFANVSILKRPFDDHCSQWNFGLDACDTPWVLSLDADYVLEPELVSEITKLDLGTQTHRAYAVRFRYCINGHALRATLYPSRIVLFQRARARYAQDGHTQILQCSSAVAMLDGRIRHDDRKRLDRWLVNQTKYACQEADKLTSSSKGELGLRDRIRLIPGLAPCLAFCYCYFVRGLVFDGRPGLYYSLQRAYAELLLSLVLLEREFERSSN